jgi:hypothetical protein
MLRAKLHTTERELLGTQELLNAAQIAHQRALDELEALREKLAAAVQSSPADAIPSAPATRVGERAAVLREVAEMAEQRAREDEGISLVERSHGDEERWGAFVQRAYAMRTFADRLRRRADRHSQAVPAEPCGATWGNKVCEKPKGHDGMHTQQDEVPPWIWGHDDREAAAEPRRRG